MECQTCGKKNAKEKRVGIFGSLWLCKEHSKQLDDYLSLSKEEKEKRIIAHLEKNKKTLLNGQSASELFRIAFSGGWTLNLPLHPISHHSEKELKKEFEKLIDCEVKRRKLNKNLEKYKGRNISVIVKFFIIRNKDVDNMTKPLFDTLKNKLFGDDMTIQKYCVEKSYVKDKIHENIIVNIKRLN